MTLSDDFLPTIQRYVAVTAIGPSALRNQGDKGVIDAAREFLSKPRILYAFNIKTEGEFRSQLNMATDQLTKALPKKAQSWGASRKSLNLFLRDAFYLADCYRLSSIEHWLELPLDSAVASGLTKKAAELKLELPSWPGLKRLIPSMSSLFQSFAEDVAKKRGQARVHLDMYLWLEERK
jgi:hypothetical protein